MSDVARYRRVYAQDWHDPAFRALNASARVVRLYVSAGPQTTSVGCFRLSTAVACEDLGGTADAFEQDLEAVCKAFEWSWDPLARVVWIRGWFDQNPPANPNVVHAWAKLLRNVPDCDTRSRAIADINHRLKELPASFREPWRELSKSFSFGERKAQSRTETIQGAGDQRSQRSENGGTGASRGMAENDKTTVRPEHLLIAKETLKLTSPKGSPDDLLNAFREVHSNTLNNRHVSKHEAIAALNLALAGLGMPALRIEATP